MKREKHYLTVGELRKMLVFVPDDAEIVLSTFGESETGTWLATSARVAKDEAWTPFTNTQVRIISTQIFQPSD